MPKKILEDAKICLSLLTRLPVRKPQLPDGNEDEINQSLRRIGQAYRAAPLVGLVSGLAGAIAYFLGNSMPGNPVYLAAVMAVGAQLLVSGGSQEIGFAKVLSLVPHPSADSNGHDEGAGVAAGAIGAGLMVLMKIFLVAELAEPWSAAMGLVASSAIGRAAQVQLMAFSTSDAASQPSKIDATTSMIVGAVIGAFALLMSAGMKFFLPVIGAIVGTLIATMLFFTLTKSRHHLDNINVKEALCLVVELGALFGIVALMPFNL